MGNHNSKFILEKWGELEDSSVSNIGFSKEHNISAWDYFPAKNMDYYNGKRFFKISRGNYRYYDQGYLYGYNYNETKFLEIDDYPLEKSF